MNIYEAENSPKRSMDIRKAEGQTSGSFVYAFPPDIPILLPGEVIDEKSIEDAKYVVFEYGGNDCDHNWKEVSDAPLEAHYPKIMPSVFVQQYEALINRVRNMDCQPVILSMPLIDPDKFFDFLSSGLNRDNILSWLGGRTMRLYQWHEMYNVQLFKMARRLQVPIIDITTPFLNQGNYTDYLCDDGIHPNEKGHALIADTVTKSANDYFSLNLRAS